MEDESDKNVDKNERKPPKWLHKLSTLIDNNWRYHAPCKSINFKSTFVEEEGLWSLEASPPMQEVFGGNEDGQQVWSGFVFDIGDFSREEGVWVQEWAAASLCKECSESPKIMVIGKYRGHKFKLQVILEPDVTQAKEIIDVIRKEVRNSSYPHSGEDGNDKDE